MDFNSMKVAELREYAKKQNIDTKGMKKAEIISALTSEPDLVSADVIEPGSELTLQVSTNCIPGTLSANFDAIEQLVDKIIAPYENWKPNPEDKQEVEQVKREREHISSIKKNFKQNCDDAIRGYSEPLNLFKDREKAILSKLDSTYRSLKDCEDQADEARRDWVKDQLKDHYEAYAGFLVDVVPYEKIHDRRWTNKTFGEKKAEQELEAKIDEIASKWNMLKEMKLEFYDEAEAYFFETLNLEQAVSKAKNLADQKRKVAEMKSEMSEYQPSEPASIPKPVSPKPVQNPVSPKPVVIQDEPVFSWVILVGEATHSQCMEAGKLLRQAGITGVFKRGNLEEVYRREVANG